MPFNRPKRITVEVDDITHSHIKKTIVDQGVTIKEWILEAIADKIRKDAELGFK